MSNKRIEYLDALKGFAIFLMVVGHVIPWNMPEYKLQNISEYPCHIGVLWNLIYSFHMPLFFMVSGYFVYNPIRKTSESICKKVNRLLVPYVISGFLLLVVRGHYGYWFLFSLFILSVFAYLLINLLNRINIQNNIFIDVVFILIFVFILRRTLSLQILNNPFCEFEQCANYALPFFVGLLMKKHKVLEKVKCNCFTPLFITFIILFSNKYWQPTNEFLIILHQIIGKVGRYLISIVGSLLFWELFRQGINDKVQSILLVFGKYSLEIYILHILFVLQIKEVGRFWVAQGYVTCLTLQILYSTVVAIFAIICSICLAKFIRRSKLIGRLLFGS